MFTARDRRGKDGYRGNPASGRGEGPVKAKKRKG
jgi:hypothetical protein